ncbi:MAG: FMN-binding protein [Oscillospiraceae bacterium]|jgi:major membrane immunogen (membrane-anchored lipoprotein)|nr:FMN-binding protein [Oscillospiraceae bacterium]
MKKIAMRIMCAVLAAAVALALTGCGGKTPAYKDGEYTGVSQTDDDGTYGEATITVEGGKISRCEFVTWQKDGTIKDAEYGKVNGEVSNQEFYDKAQLAVRAMAQYADQLVEVQKPSDVDAVSGATVSYGQFRDAVNNALKSAT